MIQTPVDEQIVLNMQREKGRQRIEKILDVYLESSSGELDTNSGFGFQAEFISGKPGKDIRFSHTRVSNQHDLEQVVILMIYSMRHTLISSFLSSLLRSL